MRAPKQTTGVTRCHPDMLGVSYFCVAGHRGDKLKRPSNQERDLAFWLGASADDYAKADAAALRSNPFLRAWLADGPVGRELL